MKHAETQGRLALRPPERWSFELDFKEKRREGRGAVKAFQAWLKS